MARKSRKMVQSPVLEISKLSLDKSMAGIYARLSVEGNGRLSQDSIQNQISYLEKYIRKNNSDIQLVKTYIDNGMTGTNFNREGWKNLIEDIKTRKINCIIVKDFSRIGRNYIEVENYLEKIFPFLGVRVISVNNNFDSKKQQPGNDMLINSLANIVNEYYAKDISRKVLQEKQVMQENGEYTSGVYPYGYKKSEFNKRKMEADPEAANVVKKIFKWRVQGKSCSQIAEYLNLLAVPSPGLYRFMNGGQAFKKSCNSKWRVEHISEILKNPVYLGHLVQGKTQYSHFINDGKVKRIPKENWMVSKDAHEAIITQEEFNIAADMAERSYEKYCKRMKLHADIPQTENLLRNKIFCAYCGHRMFRRSRVTKGIREYSYYCDTRRRMLNGKCVQATIYENPLMETVREVTGKYLSFNEPLLNKWDFVKKGNEK